MNKQRIGGIAKLRALAAVFGAVMLGALVLGSSGCNRTEYGQFPANGEGIFGGGIRPASGDTTRLLRNAHYLKMMGRPDMALKELEAAYCQDRRNIRVLDTLARTYEELGEFTRAEKIYLEALALDDTNQALHNNLCFSYYLTGKWEKAESCFRQALAKNPQNIAARNNLGLLLCRLGRQEEARRLWTEAEGEIAAQKKMQQVMVALGPAASTHYAQSPQAAPAPAPTASAPVKKTAPPAAAAPPPPVPAATPAKVAAPPKIAVKPAPAALQPEKKAAPAPVKPLLQPKREKALAAKTRSAPESHKGKAKTFTAAVPKKPEPRKMAAAPPKASPAPAPVKQAADIEKKQPTADTQPPRLKKIRPRLAMAPEAAVVEPEKPAKAAKPAPIGIELLNGSGVKHMARNTRSLISGEGVKVVSIGNYRDFGADQTVIFYRPEAEKTARKLGAKFFPQARLEIGEKFAKNADIKVLLGKDLAKPAAVAKEPVPKVEKVAATAATQAQKKAAAPAAPAAMAAKAKKPASAPAPAPAVTAAKAKAPARTSLPSYLTAAELRNTAIDIRNGTWTKNLAHQARSMLSQEGFYVAHIGNHYDFGAEQTIIYYRPDAKRVARKLSEQFFPHCQLKQTSKIKGGADVKILLGKDLMKQADVMAKLSE